MVSDAILADPVRVLRWFKKASTGKGRVLEPTEVNKRNVVALAQRVVRDDDIENPVKVFVSCVRDKNFKITNAEEDKAVAVIDLIERGPPKARDSDLSVKPQTAEEQLKRLRESHFFNGTKGTKGDSS